ncbi:MAG: hypothetical protein LBT53_09640 [Puniceicoccales bacterium]|jgi:hypothetical protein|nr:hypothetical protein [Puniceicoccales bacterium]
MFFSFISVSCAKPFQLAAFAALVFGGSSAPALFAKPAADIAKPATDASPTVSPVVVPPLKVAKQAATLVPAGDWTAPASVLDYAATKKLAQDAEAAGKIAEALTAWERVVDRTVCSEKNRIEARIRIKELRPKVAVNTDPAKAKKWKVLALVYAELDMEVVGTNGKTTRYQQKMNAKNFETIGKELAGWRDLAFEYSSGLVLLEIEPVVILKPVRKLTDRRGGFVLDPFLVAADVRKEFAKKKYDTVISYVKYRSEKGKLNVPRPSFVAATISRARDVGGVGYIMIPWGDNYPFVKRGELWGEMELHEWLHQIDHAIQGPYSNLAYPMGVAQNPDMGGKDAEYVRARDVRTWAYFYRHIMTEHITRQVWTEVTTSPLKKKPGLILGKKGRKERI